MSLKHETARRRMASCSRVAHELGCNWHTVNDTVVAYDAALVEDPQPFGDVNALGIDETLFCRVGPGASSTGARRSSTSGVLAANSSTWSRVAMPRDRANGSKSVRRLGATAWAGRCSICPVHIARPSMTLSRKHPGRRSLPRHPGAPRGAMSPEAGERPTSLGCRSSPEKLRAA
jgi:hypothetical protein